MSALARAPASGTERLVRPGAPSIAYEVRRPTGEAKAAVLLTHGFGEHRKRYAEVIDRWTALGILVVSWDLRGHGDSEGRRGHVDRFTDYVDDAVALLDTVTTHDADFRRLSPPVGFGHSMGGLITLHLALREPLRFRSVALSSPLLAVAVDVPAYKRLAGRLTSRLLPEFSLPSGIKGSDLTHDAAKVKEHDADRYNFDLASARWFTEITAAAAQMLKDARHLRLPLFCLFAGDDRIVSAPATRTFLERVSSPEKRARELVGEYHEILNETGRAKTIDEFADAILAAYSATLPAS